ncbi:MAG: CDP-alcohol phosphatidyltransferase family protein [Aquificaceae bacterium]|nr:CDP-alcohol phosphatidyltransferase family protein [Aquificaceae bacterium]MCX8164595.1 CDP-alcohol phosphatidyltransferase family protein [Aquificaceae bacterium]
MKLSSYLNLPNLLSFARLVLSPLVFLLPEKSLPAFFLLLALSDALDGFLARRLKAQTELGKVLDPLADKIMLLCGLVSCVYRFSSLPEWFFYLCLSRDLFILIGSILVASKSGSFPQARVAGKAYTLFLSIFLFLCMLGFSAIWLFSIALFLLLVSWLDYALAGVKSLKSQTSSSTSA